MKWILVLKIIIAGQTSVETREFPTEATCNLNGRVWLSEQLIKVEDEIFSITYECKNDLIR
jgi:hypothetical protein